MADTKISALTAATTPLAGTEVLPIVQSGVTKQVSVADLTAGRAVSAASLTLTTALTAANGGTGQSSYTVGDLLYASTTTALSKLADVATGNALISGGVGVAPSWGKIGLTTHVSGTLGVTNGGTGLSSATTGDLLYASGTNTWASLADVATGNALISGGVGIAPSWGKIGLTTHVSGTLPTANGGTNLTSFTSTGILYASSTSALATGSALTFDGTNFATTGNATAKAFIPTSNVVPTNGLYLQGTNTIGIATNGTNGFTLDASQNAGFGNYGYGKLTVVTDIALINSNSAKKISWWSQANGDSENARIEVNNDGATTNTGEIRLYTKNGTSLLERSRMTQAGYQLIGYTASNGAYLLQVNSQIFATSATIATSDGRYKEKIKPLTDALDLVMKLNPVSFNWKAHPVHAFDTATPTVGFIAQEVQQAFGERDYVNSVIKKNVCTLTPELKDTETGKVIQEGKYEDFYGIAEGNMVAILTKAIQELKYEMDALKSKS